MEVEEILAQIERNEGHLPRAALAEAAAHREEIIPRLLSVLEEVARDPQPFATDQNRMIHIYAMYLLAEFRERRAYPLLVKIFSAPGELPFQLADDVVTQDLGRILASVSDGDPAGIMALVENNQVNEWVRSVAVCALTTLVACGKKTREEVMTYYHSLFQRLERTPNQVWNGLANACADLCPVEVVEDLRQAYEEDLVDPRDVSWEDIEKMLDRGQNSALKELKRFHKLITSTPEALKWMDFSIRDSEATQQESIGVDDLEELLDEAAGFSPTFDSDADFPEPYRRTGPKIGRNEPCPCGSGKKYKKCCGR